MRRDAHDHTVRERRHVGPLSGLAAVDEPGCACIRSQEHRAVRVAGEERVQHHLVARSEDAQFRHHAATILIARFLVTRFPRTIPPAPMRRLNAAVVVALAFAGCEHSAPFAGPETGSDRPFAGGSPRRITFNLGNDRAPAWLPDGSGFWYSFERVDRADHDRCLALLPPDGGRIVRMLCDRIPAADDSTDAWTEPAIDAAGRIAYVASSSRVGDVAPRAGALVLATAPALTSDRVVATLPYLGSDQAFRDVAQLRWLGSDALVCVAERVGYVRPGRGGVWWLWSGATCSSRLTPCSAVWCCATAVGCCISWTCPPVSIPRCPQARSCSAGPPCLPPERG